jgi:hypothetical protein
MAHEAPVGLLPEPVVQFDQEGGHTVSAYMKLRDGVKAVGCVQPNPDALVFFYIAADGFPIGIRFHEPASGVAVCTLVDSLVEGPSGPEGVSRSAQHQFLTNPKDLSAFLRALKHALKGLENHPGAETRPT